MKKKFIYDTIIDAGNICNLEHEIKLLKKAVDSKKKVVVYGPRNYGKTSVMQSVVIPHFRKVNKESFVFFADLMEVKSESALNRKMTRAFELSFAKSFPATNLLSQVTRFIGSLSPILEIDPITSLPSISLEAKEKKRKTFWQDIFRNINDDIAKKIPTLIVLDEFQDIAMIDGAQGMFRQVLQEFNNISVVILGSKQHILANIFAKPNAPLANFGEDIEFYPIGYQVYHEYMLERFKQKNLKISFEDSRKLQDLLQRVPEAINIVCGNLYERLENKTIKWEDATDSLFDVLAARQGRYEKLLSYYTEHELDILINIQKSSPLEYPNGKEFLKSIIASPSGARKIIRSFYDSSTIEKTSQGYRLSDPLLAYYIGKYH